MSEGHSELRRSGELLLLLCPTVAVVMLGTTRWMPWLCLAAMALGAWFCLGGSMRPLWRLHRPMAGGLMLWAGYEVLQVAPLPPTIVAALAPASAELWALGPPGGEPPATWTLHRSPGEGAFRALQAITITAFAGAIASRVEAEGFGRRARMSVVAAGIVGTILCVVHTALGARALFGFWEPLSDARAEWLAPIVNSNHWTAFLTLASLATAGLALERGMSKVLGGAALVVAGCQAALVFASDSRGGMIGFAAGVIAFGVLSLGRAARKSRTRAASAWVAVAAAVGLAALGVARESPSRAMPWIGEKSALASVLPRVENLEAALASIRAEPWIGIGEGAFPWVRARLLEQPGSTLFQSVESQPVQIMLDHGVVVGSGILLAIAAVLFTSLRIAWRQPRRIGAAAALVGLAVHECADFATDSGAVMTAALALAVVAVRRREEADGGNPGSPMPYVPSAACAALLIPLAWGGDHRHLRRCLDAALPVDDHGALRRHLDPRTLGAEEWSRHPGAYLLPEAVGAALIADGDPGGALPWLNRAQLLAPGAPDPHLLTARALDAVGASDQALIEYGLAMRADWDGRAFAILAEVRTRHSGEAALLALVPSDDEELRGRLAFLLHQQGDSRFPAVARAALPSDLTRPVARVVRALERLSAGDHANAASLAADVLADPGLPEAFLGPAVQVLVAAGDIELAYRTLEAALLREGGDSPILWLGLGRLDRERGRFAEARLAFRRARAGSHSAMVALSLVEESLLEAQRGEARAALDLAERATAVDAGLPGAWMNLAERRLAMGDSRGALHAIDWSLRLAEGYGPAEVLRAEIVSRLEDAGARGPRRP